MSLISVNNLTFCYEGSVDNVFENVIFQIDTDWKLGLVGRNGRGKTTFLNLLMGKYEYEGSISHSVQFDYFPFEIEDKTKIVADIISGLLPNGERWRIERELALLDVCGDCLDRRFDTLSGGEQSKVLLATMFLKENSFLLIDEPTNNLDLEGRKSLAKYLDRKKSFILVSHDRNFLDGCVDHILSINRADIEVQSGNFSSWITNKERRDAFEIAENEKLKNEIGRLRQSAKQSKDWSQKGYRESTGKNNKDEGLAGFKEFHRKKAGKLDSQVKVMEKRQNRAIEEKSGLLKNIERVDDLSMTPLIHTSDWLAKVSRLSINYGNKTLFEDFNLTINKGDRVALVGKNGSGKSSILKLLLKEASKNICQLCSDDKSSAINYGGEIRLANRLGVSYVSQSTAHLTGGIRDFAADNDLDETKFMTILAKLDFSKLSLEKDLSDLSSGQKKKILIAKSLCESAHLYIWDEPLGYIDIFSRMQIEKLLENSHPTMIFVEHDSAFTDKIATSKIQI